MSLTLYYQDIFATSVKSNVSHATEPVWPAWTDVEPALKNLKLTDQVMELPSVICWTIAIVEEWYIFEDSYPGLIERSGWNQRAIAQACEEICCDAPAHVKAKYQVIADRLVVDCEYLKEISSLVSHCSTGSVPMLMLKVCTQLDPHISLHRGIARNVGTSNIKSYGIFSDNTVNCQLVNNLLFKYNYIYALNVCIIIIIALTFAQ